MVAYTVDRQGLTVTLQQSSGYALLDEDAESAVRRASQLPVPPTDLEGELVTVNTAVNFFLQKNR